MSLIVKNFSVMAYANGFTLWNYSTIDKLSDLKSDGYFNATSPFVRAGDMIMAVADKDGELASSILVASKVTDNAVIISSLS